MATSIERAMLGKPANAVVRVDRDVKFLDFVDGQVESLREECELLRGRLAMARDDARLGWTAAVVCFLTLALVLGKSMVFGGGL